MPEERQGAATPPTSSKPFPYWPAQPTPEMQIRSELMMELDKWSNNDPFLAKRCAESFILILAQQFNINLLQINE
jgi:hypothetical protein